MVVVGLQDSHLRWYGLELGPAPLLWTTMPLRGVKTGMGAPVRCICGFRLPDGPGGRASLRFMYVLWRS